MYSNQDIQRKLVISRDEINRKLNDLAHQIINDHNHEPILLIGVLTGGFIVLADLARSLWDAGQSDIEIDFVKTTSYIDDTVASRHQPKIVVDLNKSIEGKNVIIVEDIADTGHTLHLLQKYLSTGSPKKLSTLALLNKPSRREVEINLDYIGFEVTGWIEGYGLDSIRACPDVMERI